MQRNRKSNLLSLVENTYILDIDNQNRLSFYLQVVHDNCEGITLERYFRVIARIKNAPMTFTWIIKTYWPLTVSIATLNILMILSG